MSVWKETSASPTENASTPMAPLPVLVPLATGLDLVEHLVWVSLSILVWPYLSMEKVGLQQGKEQGKEGRKGTLDFWRVWENLHDQWGEAFEEAWRPQS